MNHKYTFIAQWHDAIIDPPYKNGDYIVCSGQGIIEMLSYAKNLYKIDEFDFADKKNKSGWYDYDSEYGYYVIDNIQYWMELPNSPIIGRGNNNGCEINKK